jgi:hypothetical protein
VTRRRIALAVVLAAGVPRAAAADVVDEAFARGNERARAGDWAGAIVEYERAASLLPGRSAALSYDLGTAYAHAEDPGRAIFHLRRALQPAADPSHEIVAAAQRNLGIVQRRAELDAAASGARLAPPEGWGDRFVSALTAPGFGWAALVAGWLAVVAAALREYRRRRGRALIGLGTLALASAFVFVVVGSLHAAALRSVRNAPRGIALERTLEVRDGPGEHHDVAFRLQGGSPVRVVDRAPGWSKVRIDEGLEGWVPHATIGELEGDGAKRADG